MSLNNLTIAKSRKLLIKKEISSKELVTSCLSQIEKTDSQINAFVTVCKEKALEESEKSDNEIDSDNSSKSLLGIPVAIKDNYNTQGIRTTASSKLLDNYIPVYDCTVWSRLKNAGAILLGKTNMDAWAHGSSTETSDYGSTKNPWDTGKLPGGSSGGSGAAVAAHETIFAMGSETAGSIRGPASWCGVVGLKPTYGRTSRYGIIAMGSSLDSPGPMTKTVEDAAIVLNVIAGKDPMDATSSTSQVLDYTTVLGTSIKGMRIGFSSSYFEGVENEVINGVKEAMRKLESLGAGIEEIKLFEPKYAIAVYTVIQRAEVSSNLARFDGIRYGLPRQAFGEEAKKRIMLGTYVLSSGYYDAYYKKAESVRAVIIEDFNKAFQKVDAIVGPTLPSLALPVGSSKGHPMFGEVQDILVEPSSIAGLCGISIPCGFSEKLPIGVQFIGPQFREDVILQIAHAYEQATKWHYEIPEVAKKII